MISFPQLIRNGAILLMLVALVTGGFLCLLSGTGTMSHMQNHNMSQSVGTHVSFATGLMTALVAIVTILAAAVASVFLAFVSRTDGIAPSAVSHEYTWSEPPSSIHKFYSWLSHLVRSPGHTFTA